MNKYEKYLVDSGKFTPNVDRNGIHYGVFSGGEMPEGLFEQMQHNCTGCEYKGKDCSDIDCMNDSYIYAKNGLVCTFNSNTNTGMVIHSDRVIWCAYCSPCYPNAGDLSNECYPGIDTYTFNERC